MWPAANLVNRSVFMELGKFRDWLGEFPGLKVCKIEWTQGYRGEIQAKKIMEKGGEEKENREKRIRIKRNEKRTMDFLHPSLSGPSHLKGDFLMF